MTTTQLTKLKDAGFTLEQIIAIGEIFDPAPKPEPAPPQGKASALRAVEEARKAYEKGRKEAEEKQRQKDFGPAIRNKDPEFQRRCEDFKKTQQDSMFLGSMELPPLVKRAMGRAAEIAKAPNIMRWNTQTYIER